MPARSRQYESQVLHPVFQMNMPEGFLLEEQRNCLAKTLQLGEMALFDISRLQAPIGRLRVHLTEITGALLNRLPVQKGDRPVFDWRRQSGGRGVLMAVGDQPLIQLCFLKHVCNPCFKQHILLICIIKNILC